MEIREPKKVSFHNLESLATDLARVAFILAHPDDETFCSGLICELVSRGITVRVFCLTRGEGGPSGSFPREDLGQLREREMKEACRILGVNELTFLGYVDPPEQGGQRTAPAVSASELSRVLAQKVEGADWVVSHGSSGEYGHAAHLLVFNAVRDLAGQPGAQFRWWTLLARDPDHPMPRLINAEDKACLRLDVSGFHEKRLAALSTHLSQRELFQRFSGGNCEDFIRQTAVESYCWQNCWLMVDG